MLDGQLLGQRFILARDFRGLHVPGFDLAELDQGQFTVAGACTWQRCLLTSAVKAREEAKAEATVLPLRQCLQELHFLLLGSALKGSFSLHRLCS